ncbi:unnamed protein product [Ambrosiozyma monospora]|uniref:Unnamed protein product n=1 Tax=Ambrosiozyma monospora TaxID=43982 RepID=A0ACB5TCX6_AMBMO|nr:unnamed protein product [Ambrosiozyma monospora]
MQFSSVLVFASSALAAYSNCTDSTITYETTVEQVVTAYTTYCPEATEITTNGKTITVTGATTLTITDCPCTIKSTFLTSGVVSSAPATSPATSPATVPVPAASKAVPSKAVVASSSGSAVVPTLSTAEGSAAKVGVAGLAAIAGVAAYLL